MPIRSVLIHLSDMGFGPFNRARSPSRESGHFDCADQLVADVKWLLGERNAPSDNIGLVVTGDIAYAAAVDEYEDAYRTIGHITNALRICPQRVALVPGNHDINWSDCKVAALAAGIDLASNIDRSRARLLPQKLANFSAFFERFTGTPFPGPGCAVSFPGFLELGLAIVGLDTTLPCAVSGGDNCGILQEETAIAAANELATLRSKDEGAVGVAVMHHCPNPYAEQDLSGSLLQNVKFPRQYLTDAGFQLTLCGHEHQQEAEAALRTGYQIFCVGSYGLDTNRLVARYRRNPAKANNRYQMFFLDADRSKVQCLLRKLRVPGSLDSGWTSDDAAGPDEFPVVLRTQFHKEGAGPREIRVSFGNPVRHPSRDGVFVVCAALSPDDAVRSLRAVRYLTPSGSVNRNRHQENFRVELELPADMTKLDVELVLEDGSLFPLSVALPAFSR